LLLLSRTTGIIDLPTLQVSIEKTFHHRDTTFELIEFSEEEFKPISKLWTAHIESLGQNVQSFNLPLGIKDVIKEINAMLMRLKM